MAGPERVSEGITREGASIGLFSGSHWPGGCAEQRPSHPLPGEATSAGCCRCRPLPNRAARERHSGPYLCRSPLRGGSGRGGARRGGEGAAAAGAPGAAGERRGAAGCGVPRARVAVGTVLRALGLLQSCRRPLPALRCTVVFLLPPFFSRFEQLALPSQSGRAQLPQPPAARPGTALLPLLPPAPAGPRAAAGRRGAFCSAFPCASRPVFGGDGRCARAGRRLRWFLPGKKSPPPRDRFLRAGRGCAALRPQGNYFGGIREGGRCGRHLRAAVRRRGHGGELGLCLPRGGGGCEAAGRTERSRPGEPAGRRGRAHSGGRLVALRRAGGGGGARLPLGGGSAPLRSSSEAAGSIPPLRAGSWPGWGGHRGAAPAAGRGAARSPRQAG